MPMLAWCDSRRWRWLTPHSGSGRAGPYKPLSVWLALAALWTGLGLHDRRQTPVSRLVWVTGALANVALALALAGMTLWPTLLGRPEPILLLALAGALLLWLSLGLRRQILFYGVLACAAGTGVLVKRGFFPGPSTGLIEFALVAGFRVVFLWWLNWRRPGASSLAAR